ncbi:valacyclovir hydrolase [Ixodes scapularis]|nr:valacyclovir hydrolase [Ixodes scapularis]
MISHSLRQCVFSTPKSLLSISARCFSKEMAQKAPGKLLDVLGYRIHFETVGNGPKVLVLLPGAIGSTRTDFSPQLEKLDRKQFTLVAWDPPGYGFSRPPERTFPVDFYHRDARVVAQLMKQLGHKKYNVLGWSDGANTGMILAATYPERIEKLVAFGGNSYIEDIDVQLLEATRNVEQWSKRMREPMEALYGPERFQKLWWDYCDFYKRLLHNQGGDVCRAELAKIRCPTLIVHGGKDPLVTPEHPAYLLRHIALSKLCVIPEGKHNLHLKFPEDFNKLVTDFILG